MEVTGAFERALQAEYEALAQRLAESVSLTHLWGPPNDQRRNGWPVTYNPFPQVARLEQRWRRYRSKWAWRLERARDAWHVLRHGLSECDPW